MVATKPKNKNTEISPKPKYPYGRLLPVYVQAAKIAAAPTAISQSDVKRASPKPTTAATAKEIKAACLTDLALAKPEATNRVGPTRLSSVPFTPSE